MTRLIFLDRAARRRHLFADILARVVVIGFFIGLGVGLAEWLAR